MTHVVAALDQVSFQFYKNQAGYPAVAAVDTNITGYGDGYLSYTLRIALQETAGADDSNVNFRFQVSKNGGAWGNIVGGGGTANTNAYATAINQNDPTSQVITSGSFSTGRYIEHNSGATTSSFTVSSNTYTELELAFNINDFSGINAGDTFDFRITYDDGTVINNYAITPRLTFQVPALRFTHYQWLNDDGALGANSAASGEDGSHGIAVADNQQLRLRVQAYSPDTTISDIDLGVYARINGGSWSYHTNYAWSSHYDSSHYADSSVVTSARLSSPGGSFANGVARDTSSSVVNRVINEGQYQEFEFTIEVDAAALNAGDTLEYHLQNTGTTVEFTDDVIARLDVGIQAGQATLNGTASIPTSYGSLEGVVDGYASLTTNATITPVPAEHEFTIRAAIWRTDNGSETAATTRVDANNHIDFEIGDSGSSFFCGRLRLLIENTGDFDYLSTDGLRILPRQREHHGTVPPGDWVAPSISYSIRWYASTHLTDQEATTKQLTAQNDTFAGGSVNEDSSPGYTNIDFDWNRGEFVEVEWAWLCATNRYSTANEPLRIKIAAFVETNFPVSQMAVEGPGFKMPEIVLNEAGTVASYTTLEAGATFTASGEIFLPGQVSGDCHLQPTATVAATATADFVASAVLPATASIECNHNELLASTWCWRRAYSATGKATPTTATEWTTEVCAAHIGNGLILSEAGDQAVEYYLRMRIVNMGANASTFVPKLRYTTAISQVSWSQPAGTPTNNYFGFVSGTGPHGWFVNKGAVTDEAIKSITMTGSPPEPDSPTFVNGVRFTNDNNDDVSITLQPGECTEVEWHVGMDYDTASSGQNFFARLFFSSAGAHSGYPKYEWMRPYWKDAVMCEVPNSYFITDDGNETDATLGLENGSLLANGADQRGVIFRIRYTVHYEGSANFDAWRIVTTYNDMELHEYDHCRLLKAENDPDGPITLADSPWAFGDPDIQTTERANPGTRTFAGKGWWLNGIYSRAWDSTPTTSDAIEMEYSLKMEGDVKANNEYAIRPHLIWLTGSDGRLFSPEFRTDQEFLPRIQTTAHHGARCHSIITSSTVTASPPPEAALTTSSSCSGTADVILGGKIAMTGTAAVAALGTTGLGETHTGAAVLATTGQVVALAQRIAYATAALAGAVTMSPLGVNIKAGSMLIPAFWLFAGSGRITRPGAAAMAGAGAVTIAGAVTRNAKAKLKTATTVAPTADRLHGGKTAITTDSTLTGRGKDVETGAAVITAAASLNVIGTEVRLGITSVTVTGTLTAAAQADFAARTNATTAASVSASAVIVHGAATELSTQSVVTGKNGSTVPATASITTSTTTAPAGINQRPGAASLVITAQVVSRGLVNDPDKLRLLDEENITIVVRERCETVIERIRCTTVATVR